MSFIRSSWPVIEPGRDYQHNWHIECIAEHLEAVKTGQIKRLIINIPPRHMKSISVTVAFPCWLWASRPETRFMCASFSDVLSVKHNVDRRRILQSEWYRSLFGDRFSIQKDQDQKTEFENDKRGMMVATSVGGSSTGRGGDILIIDDPLNPKMASSEVQRRTVNDWFDQTFYTRLDDKKNGAIILVMQRLHENDLTGHLLQKGGWDHLKIEGQASKTITYTLPVSKKEITRVAGEYIWPEREGEVEHTMLKLNLGAGIYAGQYQQAPSPETGNILKKYMFRFWYPRGANTPKPVVTNDESGQTVYCHQEEFSVKIDEYYQSWDMTFKDSESSDYVVGQVWARFRAMRFLVDQVRGKFDFVKTLQQVASMTQKHPNAHVKLVEDKANGSAIISSLGKSISGLIPVNPEGSKVARATAITPLFEAGNVYLPHPEYFPWVNTLIEEMSSFPRAAHDDQVDALTQLLSYTMKKESGGADAFKRIGELMESASNTNFWGTKL